MPTVAYLANELPSPVEPYVADEIGELRERGITVIPCSACRVDAVAEARMKSLASGTIYFQPLRFLSALRATWFCVRRFSTLREFLKRVLLEGNEPVGQRFRAIFHTWLGAYYSLLLRGRDVEHIHVHHGYFSSWIAMVAARLLNVGFSMTLHGSDLLQHGVYLDLKLQSCKFCITVSEFNRRYILEHYPDIDPAKISVLRLGVDLPGISFLRSSIRDNSSSFVILAVGRLHPVKDHRFLIRACRVLKDRGRKFTCFIAGEGYERAKLEELIRKLDLLDEIHLLGHLAQPDLDRYYALADLVVLTSRSEGIPLALMEAMARAKPVLAPAITGIPELVLDGETGFLYRPNSIRDFVEKVEFVRAFQSALNPIGAAAREHVQSKFNRRKNLTAFCNWFAAQISEQERLNAYENSLLQQI